MHALKELMDKFGARSVTFLVQRNMRPFLDIPENITSIDNADKDRISFARSLKRNRYDGVCIVQSGEPGFWKLKLLPLYLMPKIFFAYDRHGRLRNYEKGDAIYWIKSIFFSGLSEGSTFYLARTILSPFIFMWLGVRYFLSRSKITAHKDL